MTSLNPVLTIGTQITEALKLHMGMNNKQADERAAELLTMVGIPDASRRLKAYPHQFSGGMRQRVMIAMALSCNPKLLIADEPTTALDVTIQAQIIELVKRLKEQLGMAMIWISHDLGVVAGLSDNVQVMYGGHDRRARLGRGRVQGHAPPVYARLAQIAAAPRHASGRMKN